MAQNSKEKPTSIAKPIHLKDLRVPGLSWGFAPHLRHFQCFHNPTGNMGIQ